MAALRGAWAGVFVAALISSAWAQDEAPAVKGRGDLDRLAIRGAAAFSEAEIRSVLAVDIEVAVAARRDAPLEGLQKVLAERTRAGYLYEGFADAKVNVSFDPAADALVMEIDEGPRYISAGMTIEGLEPALADRLQQALAVAEKSPRDLSGPRSERAAAPKEKREARWRPGDPVRLGPEPWRLLRGKIESSLYDCGYLFPEFTLDAVADPAQKTIELKVRFSNPGIPARLDEIAIVGERNTPQEELLKYLGIQRGMPWSGKMRASLEERLRQSGRFVNVKVSETKPSSPDRKLFLWFEVAEYEKATLLFDPLSREEQALVRLSEWLHGFPQGDEDLLFEYQIGSYKIEAVISPQFGALLLVRKAPVDDANRPGPIVWALVTSDERIGLYSAPRGRKLVAIPTPAPLIANLELSLNDGPPQLDGKGTFKFGLGMASVGRRNRRRHCEFRFADTAVSLLSLAHEYDARRHWEGDVLTIEFNERALKFNAVTGQLLEFATVQQKDGWRLSVAQREFERKLAKLDAATRELPNDADENAARPISSVLEFLADEALAWQPAEDLEDVRPQLRLLRKMVSLGALKPLDRLSAAACEPAAETVEFWIPTESLEFSLRDINFSGDWFHDRSFQKALRGLSSHFGIRLERLAIPARGWLREVYREALYAQADKGSPDDRAVDLTRLCASPEAGPLCCLSVAAAAQALPLGVPAPLMANLGKTKLTLADFRNDYRALLDANCLLGEYVLCLAEVLRGLEQDEIEMLAGLLRSEELLDERALAGLVAVASALRERRDQPVADALSAALDQLWQLGLRRRVAGLLARFAAQPAPNRQTQAAASAQRGNRWAETRTPLLGRPYGGDEGARNGGGEVSSTPLDLAAGLQSGRLPQASKLSIPSIVKMPPNVPRIALDGYCPVTLVQMAKWELGDSEYTAIHNKQVYLFASDREKAAFLANPQRYGVANGGFDIVAQVDRQRTAAGRRDYGVVCNRRILLFESEESLARFERDSQRYLAALPAEPTEVIDVSAPISTAPASTTPSPEKNIGPASAAKAKRPAFRVTRRRLSGLRFR